jgi:hypothetical protein
VRCSTSFVAEAQGATGAAPVARLGAGTADSNQRSACLVSRKYETTSIELLSIDAQGRRTRRGHASSFRGGVRLRTNGRVGSPSQLLTQNKPEACALPSSPSRASGVACLGAK